jgi:hypothetical protein
MDVEGIGECKKERIEAETKERKVKTSKDKKDDCMYCNRWKRICSGKHVKRCDK